MNLIIFNSFTMRARFVVLMYIGLIALITTVTASEKPEKIFRHDRLDPQKFARVDLDNEEFRRAIEDLRRRVPEYTGYLVFDILFEICKMWFLFLLSFLGHQQQQDSAST